MNSGKSTALIQAAYNYEERGMHVVIVKANIDTKGGDKVISRLGVTRSADIILQPSDNATELLKKAYSGQPFQCVLLDEAQFITPTQAEELFWYAVDEQVPVLAFGLRADFMTKGFPGSTRLLELAHEVQELKTICRCGKKALFNGRKVGGKFVSQGVQVAIEDEKEVIYESLCANCYKELVLKKT